MLRVNTIYPAFMGEVNCFGIGAPCTFIRLAGCNLRCYYRTKGILCDTPEALGPNSGKDMGEESILKECEELGNKIICLTGGEPLLQNVTLLLDTLSRRGFSIVVETNGSMSIFDYKTIPNVSFVVDHKGASSGESDKMTSVNLSLMDEKDFLKFVIDDEEDYAEMLEFVRNHRWIKYNVAVGLFWGSTIDYGWLIHRIRKDKLDVYVNTQTHKLMCMYDYNIKENGVDKIIIPKDL